MAAIEVVTKEDLKQFRTEMMKEIKELIRPGVGEGKKWLRSYEVRKILGISPNTLQTFRANGTLKFTKMGGSLYYKSEDINGILEGNLS